MVLFDESPVTLIHQTTLNFHTHSDLSSLSRISSSISTLRSARALRLSSQSATLSDLSRRVAHKTSAYESDTARHDAGAHAAEILELDTEKFRIAKGVSEVVVEGEKLEGEMRSCGEVLRRLEEGGEGEEGREVDEVVLKLRVYRSLGIDAETDGNGEFKRAVVRNTSKGDVNVVMMDPKFDRFFYASHFWGSM